MKNDLSIEIEKLLFDINKIDNEEVRNFLKLLLAIHLAYGLIDVLKVYCNEKSLTLDYLMDSFKVCERTIKYYQSEINFVILQRKDLMIYCENGLMFCAEVKAIR